MRATVAVFPGINAESEMIRTLRDVCGATVTVAWHTESELPAGTDLVAIPGGFSYGDYLRCGAIARVSPLMRAIAAHAQRGGYVLGVCNGFQILTEAGLLPGALTRNRQLRFECGLVHVRVAAQGPFTPERGKRWKMYIAHGEGRYQATERVLRELEDEDRIALRYEENPNGSVADIAGIYGGPRKNVFGLMPHPERSSEPLHGTTDGRELFDAVLAA